MPIQMVQELKGILEANDISPLKICETFEEVKRLKDGAIALITLPLEHGFINDRYVVGPETDILGDRLIREPQKKTESRRFLREVSSLNEGDYVVHIDHGIGRFDGLETLNVEGIKHDCIRLIYDGEDKLYVPVENIEVLSHYGDADAIVALDRLGAGWQAHAGRR